MAALGVAYKASSDGLGIDGHIQVHDAAVYIPRYILTSLST